MIEAEKQPEYSEVRTGVRSDLDSACMNLAAWCISDYQFCHEFAVEAKQRGEVDYQCELAEEAIANYFEAKKWVRMASEKVRECPNPGEVTFDPMDVESYDINELVAVFVDPLGVTEYYDKAIFGVDGTAGNKPLLLSERAVLETMLDSERFNEQILCRLLQQNKQQLNGLKPRFTDVCCVRNSPDGAAIVEAVYEGDLIERSVGRHF